VWYLTLLSIDWEHGDGLLWLEVLEGNVHVLLWCHWGGLGVDLGGGRWKGLARARPPVPSSAGTATEANGTAAEGDDTGQEEETTDVDVCAVVRGDWGSWSVA